MVVLSPAQTQVSAVRFSLLREHIGRRIGQMASLAHFMGLFHWLTGSSLSWSRQLLPGSLAHLAVTATFTSTTTAQDSASLLASLFAPGSVYTPVHRTLGGSCVTQDSPCSPRCSKHCGPWTSLKCMNICPHLFFGPLQHTSTMFVLPRLSQYSDSRRQALKDSQRHLYLADVFPLPYSSSNGFSSQEGIGVYGICKYNPAGILLA